MGRAMSLRQRLDYLRHLAVACTQQHHRELAPVFRPYVPEGGTVIDVGAHAGQFAKLFSRMVGPTGRVCAFEPSGYTRAILERALSFNRCRNVRVYAQGLSDRPGELVLHTPVKRGGLRGYGLASLGGVGAAAARGEIAETVPVTTLDTFVHANALHVDFIKADIEGWEGHFLRGAREVLRTQRPAIFIELNREMLARAGDDADQVFADLAALGYRAQKSPGWRAVATYEDRGDYFFTPA
jgi:FkbM family methyltransferase